MINEIEKHIGSYVVVKTTNSRRTISGFLQKNGNTFYIKLGTKMLPVNIEKVTVVPLEVSTKKKQPLHTEEG